MHKDKENIGELGSVLDFDYVWKCYEDIRRMVDSCNTELELRELLETPHLIKRREVVKNYHDQYGYNVLKAKIENLLEKLPSGI